MVFFSAESPYDDRRHKSYNPRPIFIHDQTTKCDVVRNLFLGSLYLLRDIIKKILYREIRIWVELRFVLYLESDGTQFNLLNYLIT